MSNILIVLRHGKRHITNEASGDGPLTREGVDAVSTSSFFIIKELQKRGITRIDHAVISGSIRCSQAFGILWLQMMGCIAVGRYEMDKKFFSTLEEDIQWAEFYATRLNELEQRKAAMGEKFAYMSLVPKLVNACVDRTEAAISTAFDAGAKVVLYVGHGPHDALIAGNFDGKLYESLALGAYRIIEFR